MHIQLFYANAGKTKFAEARKREFGYYFRWWLYTTYVLPMRLGNFEFHFKIDATLRTKSDSKALIQRLKGRTIDFVTTDQRPHGY